MRVHRINVRRFRSISDLDLCVDRDGIICLTGANGVGKSSILDMIARACAAVGLGHISEDFNLASETQFYDYTVTFSMQDDLDESDLGQILHRARAQGGEVVEWNRLLDVTLSGYMKDGALHSTTEYSFDGKTNDYQAQQLVSALTQQNDQMDQLKVAKIDANRSYTNDQQRRYQVAELRQWDRIWGKKAAALLRSTDLYQQWIGYLVDLNARRLSEAREEGRRRYPNSENPEEQLVGYVDPITHLSELVERVLPHIRLIGAAVGEDDLFIDTFGERVRFEDLSGGEREIIFLIGQFDRLQISNGVLLVDEPELHLNPALVRKLISVLQESTSGGQVWIATHSFEAVEAASAQNTLLLSKPGNGKTEVAWLGDSPAIVKLAEHLGRTGFSPVNTTFVLVEGGGTSLREISRFEALSEHMKGIEFIRAGSSKKDVESTLSKMQSLSDQAKGNLSFKAIVDSDYESVGMSTNIVDEVKCSIDMHEIENVFLHPASLESVAKYLLRSNETFVANDAIRESFENRIGCWVWGRTEYFYNRRWMKDGIRGQVDQLKRYLWNKTRVEINQSLSALKADATSIELKVWCELEESLRIAKMLRGSQELWKHCNGKEVLDDIAGLFDISGKGLRLETLIANNWSDGRMPRPAELEELRQFLGRQSPQDC